MTVANGTSPRSPTGHWFRPDEFESTQFDADEYVERMSRSVPLERLSERLKQHMEQLRADLVDVINADYSEFIALSDQLGNVSGAVVRMQSPLLQLKDSVAEVQGRYEHELTSLKDCLERQSQVHHAKTMLELVQDASAVMAKLESLLASLPATDPPPSLSACTPLATHLDRISSETSRLHFYLTKGSELPLMRDLKPRLDATTATASAALATALAVTLTHATPEALDASKRCIHACSLIGDVDVAHSAVCTALVRPALERAYAAASTSGAEFLNKARSELQAPLERLCGVIAERSDLATSFDVLGACVLAEVHSLLKAHFPDMFSPAVPAMFHTNYTAATDFLQWLEGRAPGAASLSLLRGGKIRASFTKAWNLAVYFSLRFQEIAGRVEEVMHTGPTATAASSFQTWRFQQTENLLAALRKCRDEGVTFPAVYDRFFKLQMQLVLRYGSWLREVQEVVEKGGEEGGPAASGPTDFAGFDAGTMKEWASVATVEKLVSLLAEVAALSTVLKETEAKAVLAQLSGVASAEAMDAVAPAMERAIDSMAGESQHIVALIVKQVRVSAGSTLLRVRNIAANYRMTAKAAPSKPSHYVSSLLTSAEGIKAVKDWPSVPEDARVALLEQVTVAVTNALKAAAVELLDSVAKTQASLSKLRRVTSGSNLAAGGGGSTLENVQAQLQLDVLEFGRCVEKLLERPAAQLVAFQELLEAVQQPVSDKGLVAGGPPVPTTGRPPLPNSRGAASAVGFGAQRSSSGNMSES